MNNHSCFFKVNFRYIMIKFFFVVFTMLDFSYEIKSIGGFLNGESNGIIS